jgi:hypothetical protein
MEYFLNMEYFWLSNITGYGVLVAMEFFRMYSVSGYGVHVRVKLLLGPNRLRSHSVSYPGGTGNV